MSARLDARQLDRLWDAAVLGESFEFPAADPDALLLFELLSNASRPTPNAVFVQTLERSLELQSNSASIPDPPTTPIVRKARPTEARRGSWPRPQARWSTIACAFMAVALVVLLSSFAITRQWSSNELGGAIPAVSDWSEDGPPTSPGIETTTLFAHPFTSNELMKYQFDQLGWIELTHGSVPPGGRSPIGASFKFWRSTWVPGVNFIEVESESLKVSLIGPAVLSKGASGTQQQIDSPTDVTLNPGDTLMFQINSLAELWNPNGTPAHYISGGLYKSPDYPIFFPDADSGDRYPGMASDRGIFRRDSLLDLSLERVAIAPGETYAYSVTPDMLLMATITGEGLRRTRWIGGAASDTPQSLPRSTQVLHSDGDGYYTLTNGGSETVDVYLLKVVPPADGAGATSEPSAAVAVPATLFSRTLSPEELDAFQSDKWNWIGVSQGTMPPWGRAVIAEGSPEAGDVGFSGLGAVSVTSGTLVANAAEGATVERGATGAIEPVDRGENVTLETGDTLFAPPNTLPALWNMSDTDATYLTGGVYTQSYITPFNVMDFDFARSGIRVDANDLAIGAPVTMSMEAVTIPAGASYSYSISSETWLEGLVTGGGLQQEKRIDGVLQGKPKTLVGSVYSLHMDGFGDYTLTNEGTETVEVSFFRIEAQGASDLMTSPVVRVEVQ